MDIGQKHKIEDFQLLKCSFYKLQAYHVGLNAESNPPVAGTPANDQEKWTFGFGRVRGLVCTIAVLFGDSSFFSRGKFSPYPLS